MTSADADFESLLAYIRESLDFESGYYNDAYLDRRITARMRRTGVDSYAEYRRLLESDDGEHEALLDSLSINVTGFFRNPEVWERLRGVLRDLSADRRRVRAWSAPCADGREPYSLSMLALDDPDVDASRIEILGTDINRDTLEVARQGRYETSQTTDIEEELGPIDDYAAYVDREVDRFCVRDRVKDLVTFERHDLIRGEAKDGFDLALCRNLLIYIDTEYKLPVIETVGESLREGGYLVVGMTETLPREVRERFEAVDKRRRVYRRA